MLDQNSRVQAIFAASSWGFDQMEIDTQHVRHASISEGSCVGRDALHCSAKFPNRGESHLRWPLGKRSHDVIDDLATQPGEICGFPIAPVAAFGKNGIVKALNSAIGHLAAEVDERCAKLSQRAGDLLTLVGRAIIDGSQSHDPNPSRLCRIRRVVGNGRELDQAAESVWSCRHEVAPQGEYLSRS